MLEQLFSHYDIFYQMVVASTLLTNSATAEALNDICAIVDFIGCAYHMEQSIIEQCTHAVSHDLSAIGTYNDQLAVLVRSQDEPSNTADALLDIKCDVLALLQGIAKDDALNINPGWFDYSRYLSYQANRRFFEMNRTALGGSLLATKEVGIMLALGIGCEKNIQRAIYRLNQCALWGDIPAIHYIAYLYECCGDKEKSHLYQKVARLAETYLLDGHTVLSDEVKAEYGEEACSLYVTIASILQDIVVALHQRHINFSFLEAITMESVDYFERMKYINQYEHKEWRDVTNSSAKPTKKLGFK